MPVVSHYDFRPVTEADLPLLARWRAASQVVRWWGPLDEDEEGLDPRSQNSAFGGTNLVVELPEKAQPE